MMTRINNATTDKRLLNPALCAFTEAQKVCTFGFNLSVARWLFASCPTPATNNGQPYTTGSNRAVKCRKNGGS